MNIKNIIMAVIVNLLAISFSYAEPVLNEETVKNISKELAAAVKNGDITIFEKYIYPGSRIIVDLDPALNTGKQEIPYDEYIKLAKMSLEIMKSADIHDELISITVDKDKNQATIEEKTTATFEMMGMKIEDVSLNKTTYGVVEGEIKVLITEDELLSTTQIK